MAVKCLASPSLQKLLDIWKCIVCTIACVHILIGVYNKNNLDSAIEIKTKF